MSQANAFRRTFMLGSPPPAPVPYTSLLQSPGLWLWYDPGDGYSTGTWLDKSGNGRHATQSSTENRPVWSPGAGPNGADVLTWSDAKFELPSLFSLNAAGAEILWAVKLNNDPPDAAAHSGLWQIGTSNETSHYPYTNGYERGNAYDDAGSTTRRGFAIDPEVYDLTAWHVLSFRSRPGLWELRINNQVVHSDASNVVGFAGQYYAPKLGEGANAAYHFDGQSSHFAVISPPFASQSDRDDAIGWMKTQVTQV